MTKNSLTALALASATLLGCSATPTTKTPDRVLPLRTLRLYETGVGYYEREGRLDADSTMTLPVPTGHLDDALKTLVVISKDGKAVAGGVEFSSSVTPGMARKLAGLPANGDRVTYRVLLASLTGVPVRVEVERVLPPVENEASDANEKKRKPPARQRETLSGRLVDAGLVSVGSGEEKARELSVVIKTDQGALRRFSGDEIVSVSPTDPAQAARIDAALDTLSSAAARKPRALRLLATSDGPITLGYVTEAPIWRPSYRLLLSDKQDHATLQGWALVHNDTDEHWKGVSVELVNGRPDSFLFPMAAPRYSRRPLAEPSEPLSTAPQLFDTTADRIWGEHIEEGIGYGSGSGSGAGYGSGHGRLGSSHRTRAPRVRMGRTEVSSSALSVGNLADIAQAEGVEAGALFSYTLGSKLDLRPHGSALVPFLARDVAVRRITLFAGLGEAARAALRLGNSTKQTLPAGPLAVFEGQGFTGETAIDRMKPRQRAFVTYGVDLDVDLSREDHDSTEEVRSVNLEEQHLEVNFVRKQRWDLVLTSRSGAQRVVYLSLSQLVNNAKVEGADELDYDKEAGHALAVFRLPAGSRQEKTLKIEEGLARTYSLSAVPADTLSELGEEEGLAAADRQVLGAAAKRAQTAEDKQKAIEEVDEELKQVNEDLERLRKHLEALGDKATGAGANPFVQRIVKAEDKIGALRATREKLVEEQKAAREAMKKELEGLSPPAEKG